jgi:serine/tyrosine/threonine adenylyltransferase
MIARHYPEVAGVGQPYRAFFEAVIGRVAALVAQWLHVGFIHGVMNTDNMSIAGETIDYGPCAFMDNYHPATVYSSIDTQGRYAYANQPRIAHWNLSRLAGALLPLFDTDKEAAVAVAQGALDTFPALFEDAYVAGFRRKLGLTQVRDEDADLLQDLLDRMAENNADFTLTFRRLSDAADGGAEADARVGELFKEPAAFTEWVLKWRQRLAAEDVAPADRAAEMKAVNPAFIPRNHRIQAAIVAAQTGDFTPFETLIAVLSKPYEDQPEYADYMTPPKPDEVVHRTFCGT